jgi:hypothetical protein
MENFVSIYRETNIDDTSIYIDFDSRYNEKHYICVINWDHGVMHACITHYKYYKLAESLFFLLFLSLTFENGVKSSS